MSYYRLKIKENELRLSSKRLLYIAAILLFFLPLTTLLFYKAIYGIYVHEPDKTKTISLLGFGMLYAFLMIVLLRRHIRDKRIVIRHLQKNNYVINGRSYIFDENNDCIVVEEKHNERRSRRYYVSIFTQGRKILIARRMDLDEYRRCIRPLYEFLQLTVSNETGAYKVIGIND